LPLISGLVKGKLDKSQPARQTLKDYMNKVKIKLVRKNGYAILKLFIDGVWKSEEVVTMERADEFEKENSEYVKEISE